jgi:hypothetical protein
MTNLCRDEVTQVVKDKIEAAFGSSFNTNGLGAILTCGVTGMKAGLSHSPVSAVRAVPVSWSLLGVRACGAMVYELVCCHTADLGSYLPSRAGRPRALRVLRLPPHRHQQRGRGWRHYPSRPREEELRMRRHAEGERAAIPKSMSSSSRSRGGTTRSATPRMRATLAV